MQTHDVVIGAFTNKKHSFKKRLTSNIKNAFDRYLLKKPKGIKSGPFKLMKREVVEGVSKIKTSNPFISGLIYYVTKDIVNVSVTHHPRKFDSSNFNTQKQVRSFSNLLINNSSILLKTVAFIGVAMSLMSIGLGGYFIFKKLFIGTGIKGWTSIVVILSFIGGLILFSLGVMGEYLIRIINGVERKPPFLIRKKTDED